MHSNCHVVTYFHKSESHGVWRILPVKKLPQTHYPIEGDRGGPFVHYKTLHTSNEYFLFMKEIDERSSDKTWSNFLTTITNWSAFLSVYGYRMHLTLLSKVLPQLWLDELNELWWHLNRHLLISELLHKSSMLRKTFGLQKRHTNHYIMWG